MHIEVSNAHLAIEAAPLGPSVTNQVHAEPVWRLSQGSALIGRKDFNLTGGSGQGVVDGSFSSNEFDQVELMLTNLHVTFIVDVTEIQGDTSVVIQGSLLAREVPSIERERIVRKPASPAASPVPSPAASPAPSPVPSPAASPVPSPAPSPASPAVPTKPPQTVRASAVTGPPVCVPACSSHGTCVPGPAGSTQGQCACACNFIGADCSRYAPLRLSTVDPTVADFGQSVRVTIAGNHLGEIALLPPPPAAEGPPFQVRTTSGIECTDLQVLDNSSIACTLPPLVPGAVINFDVKRGCATAPFSPAATLTASGCADPATLSCDSNQKASADGCGCTCLDGWRGKMCNACDANAACSGLVRSDLSTEAQAAADRMNTNQPGASSGGAGAGGASLKAVAIGNSSSPLPGKGSISADATEKEEPLSCRQGDFDFYAGTYEKVLACQMLDLPDGIEPLTISLTCSRTSLSGAGSCRLLVAPADDEDRSQVGRSGYLDCLATGCALEQNSPEVKCQDVSCSFGIYEAAIKAAMPDLKVGGPCDIHCKRKDNQWGGDAVATCFVDVDVLPFQIMADCVTSDCVDPALMQMDTPPMRGRWIAIAVSSLVASLCFCSLLVLWFARAMRMEPVPEFAPAAESGGPAHIELPDDLNQMPRIDSLRFAHVKVRVASGREIVHSASGIAMAGQVYGVIGASGSGKTTLLDAIAGVLAPGATREGSVLVGGHAIPERGVRLPAMVGYVRQEDNLAITLTPRENVWFAAQLTLPHSATQHERSLAVDSTLRSLGLSHIADTQLGGNAAALQRVSGGERRRVAIAMSMVCSPRVLLLDEPTSGLDSASAHRLISTLRTLAVHDRVVMLSIHQPAQRTFELLDTALLMHKGSPVVVGPIAELYRRVASAGVPCPHGYNLADHLLDVTLDARAVARLRDEARALISASAIDIDQPVPTPSGPAPWEQVRLARGVRGALRQAMLELRALYWRIGLNVYRHPALLRLHLGVVLVLGALVGLVFHGVGDNLASFQNRSGACFFVLALFGFSGLSAMEVFISEQELMLRELQAGYYRLYAYFIAKVSVDVLLLRALPAILFSVIFYPTMGLRAEMSRFETFVEVTTLTNIAGGMLCAAISVLFESLGAANLAATIMMLLMLLMNGALVNLNSVSKPLQVVQSLSFLRYAFESLLCNELEDTIVMVDAPGITPIPVKSRVFLGVLGMSAEHIPHNKLVLIGFCVGHAALAAFLLSLRASSWRPRLPFASLCPGRKAKAHEENPPSALSPSEVQLRAMSVVNRKAPSGQLL